VEDDSESLTDSSEEDDPQELIVQQVSVHCLDTLRSQRSPPIYTQFTPQPNLPPAIIASFPLFTTIDNPTYLFITYLTLSLHTNPLFHAYDHEVRAMSSCIH
jgi:hypothetical protein